MTTYISLNRAALFALIDADPEFALDLKKSVVAEVGRRFFEKDAKRVIAAAEPELFAQALKAVQDDVDLSIRIQAALRAALTHRDSTWLSRTKISADTQKAIDEAVEETKRQVVMDASMKIGNAYGEAIQKAVDSKLTVSNVDELIERRVNNLVTKEVDRLAEEKFQQRMADIRAMMK